MAYYPYMPQSFQNPFPAPQIQQPINSMLTWVQGENGAKSYLIAPNTTVALWDSEDHKIYIKSSDASGMPQMKTLEYKVLGGEEIADKDELSKLKEEIESLREDIDLLKKTAKENAHVLAK